MFVLDTNVVSELRKADRAHPAVLAWQATIPTTNSYLPAIPLFELEHDILLIERRDNTEGATLRLWMTNHVLPAVDDRILSIDAKVARRCAASKPPTPAPTETP